MAIRIDRPPALAAQNLIERQPGSLAQNVPQGHIDAADRIVERWPVPPIAAEPRGLPDVLDLRCVLADQERLKIFIDGRLHDAGLISGPKAGFPRQSRQGFLGV